MKKNSFLRIFALIGVIMLSLVSCENWQEKIDDLQAQINANKAAISSLDQAIKAGKLITSVNTVADGSEIVFSDGSKVLVKNGKNGTNGFAPIMGVDADGYWTVIKSEGATPVRILDSNNNPIKAVAEVPYVGENGNWFVGNTDTGIQAQGEDGEDGDAGKPPYINTVPADGVVGNWMVWEDGAYVDSGVKAQGQDVNVATALNVKKGYLYVGDVKTNVEIQTPIAFNSVTNQLVVTIWNSDETFTQFNIPQANNVVSIQTISSIIAPTTNAQQLEMTASWALAISLNDNTKEAARKSFAGISKDDYMVYSTSASFITNPTEVNTAGYTVELVNPKDVSVFTVNQEWQSFGYEGSFNKVAAQGGLWRLLPAPTKAEMTVGTAENLAVKVSKNGYTIRSPYVYKVNVATAVTAALTEAPVTKTYDCGAEKNLFVEAFSAITTEADLASKIYKYEIKWTTDASNEILKPYITIDAAKMLSLSTPAAVATLAGKTAKFNLVAVDRVGAYTVTPLNVTFTGVATKEIDLTAKTYTLAAPTTGTPAKNSRAEVINVSLSDLFAAATSYGFNKTDITGGTLTFNKILKNGEDVTSTIVNGKGITVEPYVKLVGNTGTDAKLVTATADWTSMNLVFDPANVHAAEYQLVVSYVKGDVTFKLNITVVVSNPSIESISAEFVKIANLFDGNKIDVYGDQTAGASLASFDLTKAYTKTPVAANFKFMMIGPKLTDNSFQYPDPMNADGVTFEVKPTTIYKPYEIGVEYYYFGNIENKVSLSSQTIIVTPKSDVKEGSVSAIPSKVMTVSYGGAAVNMKDFFIAKSFLSKINLAAFSTAPNAMVDGISGVEVKAIGANANLVTVARVASSGDFTVVATQNAAGLLADTKVTLEVSIADKFNQKLVKTVEVTVLKP